MNRLQKTKSTGIYRVHQRTCGDRSACKCPPAYQATVSVLKDGRRKLVRRHFNSLKGAQQWRADASVRVHKGEQIVPTKATLYEAAVDLVDGMKTGRIFDRSGRRYKPSTVRGYETHLKTYIVPRLGLAKLSSIQRRDLQAFVEQLQAEPLNLSASTIRNVLCPLQVIFGRALHDEQIAIDPTVGLRLPAARGKRDRVASPEEARVLLDALPDSDRPLWATAVYAGLRRGELQALRWRHVDFDARVIRVEASWDQHEREIEVKTESGERTVPMADVLRKELAAYKLRSGRSDDDLVFGRTPADAFVPSTVRNVALVAWGWEQAPNPHPDAPPRMVWVKARPDAFEPIGLHECRHCFASFFLRAGADLKAVSSYMGHSDVRMTANRYGHLVPGSLSVDADRLSAFLDARPAVG